MGPGGHVTAMLVHMDTADLRARAILLSVGLITY